MQPYDLKKPIQVTDSFECKAIEFREPRGLECGTLIKLIGMFPAEKSNTPLSPDIAQAVVDFVAEFGEVVGDKDFPAIEVARRLAMADILGIATEVAPDFLA